MQCYIDGLKAVNILVFEWRPEMALAQKIADTSEARDVEAMMQRAREAQAIIEDYSQEQIDELITAMVWAVCQPGVAEKIAQHTLEETQLGNYAGKFAKISVKTRAALMDIIDDKSVGVIEEDKERAIVKIAKPIGVIGALSPSTNPEATPVIKAINAVKGRNAIIICPHPRAKLTNKMIVDLMREAIVKMGAPADLVQAIDIPSLELTNEVMAQCDLVMATGGAAMVQAAYSSGTPAYGVGAGNAVITGTKPRISKKQPRKSVFPKHWISRRHVLRTTLSSLWKLFMTNWSTRLWLKAAMSQSRGTTIKLHPSYGKTGC